MTVLCFVFLLHYLNLRFQKHFYIKNMRFKVNGNTILQLAKAKQKVQLVIFPLRNPNKTLIQIVHFLLDVICTLYIIFFSMQWKISGYNYPRKANQINLISYSFIFVRLVQNNRLKKSSLLFLPFCRWCCQLA